MLFSYLGFLTIIKETLIQGKKPDSIHQNRWDNILEELQDDDKWEKRVFEELNNSSTPVFNIKDDIRQQIKFWKDRRNDCAHFKSNIIESHHVESFWSFLKSNLSKITIEGGKENLLKKFIDHFDYTKTHPNKDFTYLINEIENAIELREFESFLEELENEIDPIGIGDKNLQKLHSKMLELCPKRYSEKIAKYLKNSQYDLDFELISSYPDKVNFLGYTQEETRQIWKKRLFKPRNRIFIFQIYAALIRNSLIPTGQLSEAFEELFNEYDQYEKNDKFPQDEHILSSLNHSKLGEIIFNKAIKENQLTSFMWVNRKCDFIAFYIEYFPLQKETVEVLWIYRPYCATHTGHIVPGKIAVISWPKLYIILF